jgi:hypothetical protein
LVLPLTISDCFARNRIYSKKNLLVKSELEYQIIKPDFMPDFMPEYTRFLISENVFPPVHAF